MWIPKLVIDYLKISKEAVDDLRMDLAAIRSERDSLRMELQSTKTNFDWVRIRVNQLEMENKALIQKAYDIRLPAPELARTPPPPTPETNPFEDIGDALALRLGMPIYGPPTKSDT